MADKAHRVGKDRLAHHGQRQGAQRGIERRKELIVREDLRVGESVQERGFTGIGVTDEGNDRQGVPAARLTVLGAAAGHHVEAFADDGDALAQGTAI